MSKRTWFRAVVDKPIYGNEDDTGPRAYIGPRYLSRTQARADGVRAVDGHHDAEYQVVECPTPDHPTEVFE